MTNVLSLSAGLCAGQLDLFFSRNRADIDKAMSLCDQCQLYWKCLEYTLHTWPEYGVFAGLTRQDRILIKGQRVKVATGD